MSVSLLISNVQVTGSQVIYDANFRGIGGTLVLYSGSNILISGGAGGGGAGDVTQAQLDSLSGFTTGVSGYLQDQISMSSAGVVSLNGGSGSLDIVGTGGISVSRVGQIIYVSGQNWATSGDLSLLSGWANATFATKITTDIISGNLDSLSGYAEGIYVHRTGDELISGDKSFSGNMLVTGGNLVVRSYDGSPFVIDVLASQFNKLYFKGNGAMQTAIGSNASFAFNIENNIGGDIFTILQGGNVGIGETNPQTNLHVHGFIRSDAGYQSGTTNLADIFYPRTNPSGYLTGFDSGNYATQANLALTGQQAWTAANNNGINLSGQLTLTGQTLINLITNSSGLFVYTGSELSYLTGIPTGSDKVYFNFLNYTFPTIPRVTVTLETLYDNCIYGYMISGRSTTGFWSLFTDTILESGYSFNVFAKV